MFLVERPQNTVEFIYKGKRVSLSLLRDEGNLLSLDTLEMSAEEMESLLAKRIQEDDVDLTLDRWVYMCKDFVAIADITDQDGKVHFDFFFLATAIVVRKKE